MKRAYLPYGMFIAGALLALTITATAQLPDAGGDSPMPSLAPLVEKVSPAVVNIRVSQTIQGRSPYADEMFRRFFGLPEIPGGQTQEVAAVGSGVIVDAENGYILTNNHVVENADEVQVFLYNEDSLEAEVVGTDPATDIAVLKVDPDKENLVEIPIGDSEELRVGDFVIAIGNPFALGNTVTSGIVSALGRSGISQTGLEDFIQTDASINPGNSGGALVNMRGELVGINSAIISRTGGNIGIGFAVPTEIAGSIMKQILEYGEVRRGLLGVTITTIDEDTAEALGAEVDHGALVSNVQEDSAAEEAGLKVDDIIVEVNDERIDDSRDLANAIGLKGPGDEVTIEYLRNGERQTTTAKLGERSLLQASGSDIHPGLTGALFTTSTEGEGAVEVTDVEPRSPAAQRGLRPGDLIIAVNRVRVQNVEDLQEIATRSDILFLLVRRGDRQLMLQVR
ncbi:MAG TPA: DegQ family serine endoprotease [Woeseiaceae bacterium]|nr:DegQ family serine endoprotease [Woeseiaceae bacterium]